MSELKLSIVIPVYNERATIGEILRRVLSVPLPGLTREVILVDDGSTDGTRQLFADIPVLAGELAAAAEIHVLLQKHNQGRGPPCAGALPRRQVTSSWSRMPISNMTRPNIRSCLPRSWTARLTWSSGRDSPAESLTACCASGMRSATAS